MDLWPHQQRAIDETLAAITRGERRICLTSPTGGGKTVVMAELIDRWLDQGMKVALYTNRRLLVEQTSRVMLRHGIDHGVRAAGWHQEDGPDLPVQVCSIQTEDSRVFRQGRWQLHDADRVLVDECHQATAGVARKILEAHHEAGAAYVGVTATPIGLAELYDHLIVAGTPSELRACGALVPCLHYGCDEPDLKGIGRVPLGEDLTEKQNVKAMMVPGIFGRVLDWWRKLNPEQKPTILFAPGVAESLWFAEQFVAAGVPAAHIDGQEVWVNGGSQRSDRDSRDAVLAGSRDGSIRVVCNRFVLREGIDAPWLCHGILATVFGSLQSYLQAGGRLLRAHPGVASITIQDHGGSWWRHGSLNADRQWQLEYTGSIVSGLREERLRNHQEPEPVRCPKCGMVLRCARCPCGWETKGGTKSRPVIQSNGELKEMKGDIFKPRRVSKKPDGPKIWERMYHRSRTEKGARTFRAAAALFAQENNWSWPDPRWPFMPIADMDWFRQVGDVPRERLTQ